VFVFSKFDHRVTERASKVELTIMETSMETRIVSLAEIKQHNTADDCWIAVHSKVWDITHFINQHPGGPDGEFP
jgi:cytochrome b involved in lipid metabolism